jgi:hypothetical protein
MSYTDLPSATDPRQPLLVTPQTVDRRRQMAIALLNASRETAPIQSWTQGAARLADALVGGLQYRQANQQEQQGLQSASSGIQKLVAALNPPPTSSSADGSGYAMPSIPASDATASIPTQAPSQANMPPPAPAASGSPPPTDQIPGWADANAPQTMAERFSTAFGDAPPPPAPPQMPPQTAMPPSAPSPADQAPAPAPSDGPAPMSFAPQGVRNPLQSPPSGAGQTSIGDILQIAQNPWLTPGQSSMANAVFENRLTAQTPQYSFATLPDGTVLRENARAGTAEPIMNAVKPQFTRIGSDEFGNPQFGWVNSQTGAVTPADGQGQPNGSYAPGTEAMLHGDDFLKTLPPTIADQVRAFATGRQAMPSGYALKTPYFQKMMQYVTQYDPEFDAVNYGSRYKTRSDFTSGKSAQSINALNTVIGHLQSLKDAGDALDNGNWQFVNSLRNTYESATGDPRVLKFNTTKKAVVDELTRVWRGSGGSEGDIKTWSDQINAANSPDQLHAVVGQIGDLLESKLNALGETYQQGMGTTAEPIQLITPQSQATLQALRGEPAQSAPPPPATPKAGDIVDGFRFKGGDPSQQGNWEAVQ